VVPPKGPYPTERITDDAIDNGGSGGVAGGVRKRMKMW